MSAVCPKCGATIPCATSGGFHALPRCPRCQGRDASVDAVPAFEHPDFGIDAALAEDLRRRSGGKPGGGGSGRPGPGLMGLRLRGGRRLQPRLWGLGGLITASSAIALSVAWLGPSIERPAPVAAATRAVEDNPGAGSAATPKEVAKTAEGDPHPIDAGAEGGPSPALSRFQDPWAPPGHAFVVRSTRVRGEVGGRRGARLHLGQRVERLRARDGWVLVLVAPGGPAGFVEADALGPRKPIEALAEQVRFSDCGRSSGALCRRRARLQRSECRPACPGGGGVGRALRSRVRRGLCRVRVSLPRHVGRYPRRSWKTT